MVATEFLDLKNNVISRSIGPTVRKIEYCLKEINFTHFEYP